MILRSGSGRRGLRILQNIDSGRPRFEGGNSNTAGDGRAWQALVTRGYVDNGGQITELGKIHLKGKE